MTDLNIARRAVLAGTLAGSALALSGRAMADPDPVARDPVARGIA